MSFDTANCCVICYETLKPNHKIKCPNCVGLFDLDCIYKWIIDGKHKECPMCRQIYNTDFISQLYYYNQVSLEEKKENQLYLPFNVDLVNLPENRLNMYVQKDLYSLGINHNVLYKNKTLTIKIPKFAYVSHDQFSVSMVTPKTGVFSQFITHLNTIFNSNQVTPTTPTTPMSKYLCVYGLDYNMWSHAHDGFEVIVKYINGQFQFLFIKPDPVNSNGGLSDLSKQQYNQLTHFNLPKNFRHNQNNRLDLSKYEYDIYQPFKPSSITK